MVEIFLRLYVRQDHRTIGVSGLPEVEKTERRDDRNTHGREEFQRKGTPLP